MEYTFELICVTLIISAVALVFGYLVSLSNAERPTLGDVLIGTAMSSGIPAILLIAFVWWAAG